MSVGQQKKTTFGTQRLAYPPRMPCAVEAIVAPNEACQAVSETPAAEPVWNRRTSWGRATSDPKAAAAQPRASMNIGV
jgi:hypothetical protein